VSRLSGYGRNRSTVSTYRSAYGRTTDFWNEISEARPCFALFLATSDIFSRATHEMQTRPHVNAPRHEVAHA